jgi:putative FmdB family regulatory protein
MPLYEYRCESCGRTHEVLQRLDEPPLTTCPDCGGALRKRASAPAFQFKGTGWYVTDYAKSGGGGAAKPGDGGAKAAEPAKSETPAPAAPAGADKPSSKSD